MTNAAETLAAQRQRLHELMGIEFLDEQLSAITATAAPNVVIAGAGSGKTEVMAARVVQLVATGQVPRERILGLTFTTLAAGELAGRIRKHLSNLPAAEHEAEPTVDTYHAFADRFVRTFGLRIGLETDSEVISDARRQQLCARLVRRSQLTVADLELKFDSVVERILGLDDALANYDVSLASAQEFDEQFIAEMNSRAATGKFPADAGKAVDVAQKRLLLYELVAEFRALKLAEEVIDFADMNRLALQIARTVPEAVTQMRSQFDAVLLDEYQDTSVAQRELMICLFGAGHLITGVGDPLQCIYSFQGASQTNITQFPQHFPTDGDLATERLALPWTLRNGEHIVAIANRLTADLRQQLALPELKAVTPATHGPGEPLVASFATAQQEVEWIAAEFQRELAAGTPAEEIAILLTTNAHVAWFHNALTQLGVPAQVRGKRDLLNLPEIAELVATLRIIAEPAANPAWVRVLTGPRWRLGPRDLAALGKFAQRLARPTDAEVEPGLDDALRNAVEGVDQVDIVAFGDAVEAIADGADGGVSTEARARMVALAAEVRHLRSQLHEPLADFVHRVARTIGLLVESAAHTDRVRRGMQVNLRSLFGIAAEFTELDGSATLFGFLDYLADAERYDAQPQLVGPVHAGAVQLMTVHAAKGLQFTVVALPRLGEGIFPSDRAPVSWLGSAGALPTPLRREELPALLQQFPPAGVDLSAKLFTEFAATLRAWAREEKWRLIYVAVTRTRRKLLATHSYTFPGDNSVRAPSEFWQLIYDAAVAQLGVAAIGPQVEVPPTEVPAEVSTALWPVPLDSAEHVATRELAELVQAALAGELPAPTLPLPDIDAAINAIAADINGRADVERVIHLPASLSVSQVLALTKDPAEFAAQLLRPMPLPPNPAASRGTAFHSWVEDRYRQLAGPGVQFELQFDELAAVEDALELPPIDSTDLARFTRTFEASEWGNRSPVHIEYPFAYWLAGRVLNGRIDAVFADPQTGGWQLIDWKTNAKQTADRLQLSIYRLAFAAAKGCDPAQVKVGFYYVATDTTVWDERPMTEAEVVSALLGQTD